MTRVSIIIPAYNAARTIERTVRSALASTVPVDVWVVDDGSEDGTGACLGKLGGGERSRGEGRSTDEGSVLHVLRQENQGAYRARLNALKQIRTPYFGFVDADDTVEPDMFEKMLAVAERDGCDVVQCGVSGIPDAVLGRWYLDLAGAGTEVDGGGPCTLTTRADVESRFIVPHLVEGQGASYIWNKIYRNQYDFESFDLTDDVTNFDDLIFNLYFFEKVQKMGFVGERLYHYSATEGSAVHGFSARKLKDFREACRMRRLLLPRYGVDPDGAENGRWLRMNRMNCVKAALRARSWACLWKLLALSV